MAVRHHIFFVLAFPPCVCEDSIPSLFQNPLCCLWDAIEILCQFCQFLLQSQCNLNHCLKWWLHLGIIRKNQKRQDYS